MTTSCAIGAVLAAFVAAPLALLLFDPDKLPPDKLLSASSSSCDAIFDDSGN